MKKLSMIIGTLSMLLSPMAAFAHATPVLYEPAAAEVLQDVPPQISIRFSERIEPTASTVTVYPPKGATAGTGSVMVSPSDPRLLIDTLTLTGTGTYTVSWKVLSKDDGHTTQGAYSFSIGAPSASAGAAGFQIFHRSNLWEGIGIWLEMLGHALLIGALLLSMLKKKETMKGSHRLVVKGIILMAVGVLIYSAVQVTVSGTEAVTIEGITGYLSTATGRFALFRLLTALIFGLIYLLDRVFNKENCENGIDMALWLLLFVWAVLRAKVSHAAASETLPSLSVLVMSFHVVGKNIWLGGVMAFAWMVPPILNTARTRLFASKMTSIAFAVGGVTGAYVVWLHLKSFQNVIATHWGMWFLTLSACAAVLLILRLAQLFILDPAAVRVANGTAKPKDSERVAQGSLALAAESIAAIAVLFASSFLVITTPPLSAGNFYQQTSESQGATITFGEHPFDDDQMLLTFGGLSNTQNVIATLKNQEKNIGPIVATLTQQSEQRYAFPKESLSPTGAWTIDVTAQQQNSYDAVASFTVNHPVDIEAAHVAERDSRLTLVSLIAALFILAAAALVYKKSRHLELQLREGASATPLPQPSSTVMTAAAAITTVLMVFLGYQMSQKVHGKFQQLCTQNGHMWHESVPMRAGNVTSNRPVMGCMLGMGAGQSHFADVNEYTWFTRPTVAVAEMSVDPVEPRVLEHTIFTFKIQDQEGNPIEDLSFDHDRILHAIAINQDLKTFIHAHTEDYDIVNDDMLKKAEFPVHFIFPAPGRYLIALDFTVRAQPFSQQFYVDVAEPDIPFSPSTVTQNSDAYEIALEPTTVTAGGIRKLSFTFTKNGKPVTDLEPYLAAPMHVAVASNDLRRFQHAHGELPQPLLESIVRPRNPDLLHFHQFIPDRFGPTLNAYVGFSTPGQYVMFAEFRHEGETLRKRMMIEVK